MDKLPPEAVQALEQGKLIEAIKIVRDRTGLGLKEAKDLVERYSNDPEGASGEWHEADWGRSAGDGILNQQGPAAMPAAAMTALAQGNKLEAIRLTRQATGLDLASAKRLVDNHQNPLVGEFGHLPEGMRSNPMAEPGRVSHAGYTWLPVIIVLLVVALVWLIFGTAHE